MGNIIQPKCFWVGATPREPYVPKQSGGAIATLLDRDHETDELAVRLVPSFLSTKLKACGRPKTFPESTSFQHRFSIEYTHVNGT